MVPFNDLSLAIAEIRGDIDAAIKRVVDRGLFLNGPEVEEFERAFAEYSGQSFCVTCASGTDALMLAAKAFGAGILAVAANGCGFTVKGLRRASEVIIDDVNARGWIDGQHVVATLLYGRYWHPYSDDARVMFDACQAHGWEPPKDSIVAWSGYPTKNLGGFGDCGWLTMGRASDAAIARECARSWHSRMSEINAAVLRTKLPHLDRWNAERHKLAAVYYDNLPEWAEPVCRPGEPTNHHIFAVLVERRDALENHLSMNGVQTKVHYREPLAELPGARRWANAVISLPMYPGLRAERVRTVCDVIRGFE